MRFTCFIHCFFLLLIDIDDDSFYQQIVSETLKLDKQTANQSLPRLRVEKITIDNKFRSQLSSSFFVVDLS